LQVQAADVRGRHGSGALVDLSSAPTTLGPSAAVQGHVWSSGAVHVESATQVLGSITTADTVTQDASAHVSGPVTGGANLDPQVVFSFTVDFSSGGTQHVEGPIPLLLPPGDYGEVVVE